jgi:hypothetical protein
LTRFWNFLFISTQEGTKVKFTHFLLDELETKFNK